MIASLDKPRLDNLANEIWKSAEKLRGKFKAYEYQGVILPLIVIRRLECVLLRWRADATARIAKENPKLSQKEIAKRVAALEKNPSQIPFYNSSPWTMADIMRGDTLLVEEHFRDYLNGFSKNVEEIIEHFNYKATVGLMVKYNRLAPLLAQYKDLEVGPDQLSNLEMGYVYEELLRRFSEQSGEQAGEHFTPREVIRLMVELLEIPIPERAINIYDPACGTGGMLSVAKEHLLDRAGEDKAARKRVERYVATYGQELQAGNYAICLSDLLIKDESNSVVRLGNSLIPDEKNSKERGDQLAGDDHRFDYMLSNPPFGVTWGGKDGYQEEAEKFYKMGQRYEPGMPRVNDGALLFLLTMLAKMKDPSDGGSRIAIIFNGSPLSNGDCGQGESEIRRSILERDLLDAIVMLPGELFYNTGIATYIWLLRNEKPESHKGRVAIIDARDQYEREPKAFGNKRNRIDEAHRAWIHDRYLKAFDAGRKDPKVKIFKTTDFGYHKVSVVFWQYDAKDKPAVITDSYDKAFTSANIKKELDFYDSEIEFTAGGARLTLKPGDKIAAKLKEAFTDGLPSEDTEVTLTHRHYVADDEYIPYQPGKDKAKYIKEFLEREIAKPIIRWSDAPQLGYEILPNKYFYLYKAPRPADELLKEFWKLEKEAEKMLAKLGEGR